MASRRALWSMACAGLLLGAGAGTPARAERPGQVANPLVDAALDAPTRQAADVFDIYQVVVDWLKRVYPAGSQARQALDAMGTFVARTRSQRAQGGAGATVEAPVDMDALMAKLRAEPPRFDGELAQNPKAMAATALLLPYLQLRGITFRCRPLVERSFVAHTAIINALRSTKEELSANGSPAALAMFEFFTYPLPTPDGRSIQFQKVSDMQAWLESDLIPTLDAAIKVAEQAVAAAPDGFRETVDLALFLKPDARFPDPALEVRDRGFSKPELTHMLAGLLGARAAAHLACAWNLDQAVDAGNALAKEHIEGFLKEKVSFGTQPRVGMTSKERYDIYRGFGALATLRSAAQSRAALTDMRAAWAGYEKAMEGYLAATPGEGEDRVVNLRYIQAATREYQVKVAPQIRAVLAGPATLNDYVGGTTIDVDVAGFLTNPPQDLKAFFPKDFETRDPVRSMRFRTGSIQYSNYDYGNPTGWDPASAGTTWRRLFPNLADTRATDGHWIAPMRAYRDLSRTYVGPILGPIVALVVD